MGGFELLAVVVFFLIGYWLVDYFWPGKKKDARALGERVSVRVTSRLEAPPERVFDAWLDPGTTGKWLFATPQGEMAKVEIDAQPGGRFLFVDRRNGEDVEHSGEYLALERPGKLAFNFVVPKFSPEATLVEVALEASGAGTHLVLVHSGVLPEYAARTEQGWQAILEGLGRRLRG